MKLRNALGSIKDVPPDLHKSGIYRIQCSTCGRFYFGKTIRKLFVRFNEHIHSAKWKNKTAIGKHISTTNHVVNISELKLVQPVSKPSKIEWYEAIHIRKNLHQNLLNIDDGNVNSPLLNLFNKRRVIDKNIIDLPDDDVLNSSNEDVFFECE